MYDPGRQLYKIGNSIRPKERRTELNIARPDDLEIVFTGKTDKRYPYERLAHALFVGVKINREWFDLDSVHDWREQLAELLGSNG